MKYLSQFNKFDFEEFSKEKRLMVVGCAPWRDQSGVVLGTKVDTVIFVDNTQYTRKEGDTSTNQFEKLTFKVSKQNLDIPRESVVKPVNPIATIWGDFRNQLSVKCDDMLVAQKKG